MLLEKVTEWFRLKAIVIALKVSVAKSIGNQQNVGYLSRLQQGRKFSKKGILISNKFERACSYCNELCNGSNASFGCLDHQKMLTSEVQYRAEHQWTTFHLWRGLFPQLNHHIEDTFCIDLIIQLLARHRAGDRHTAVHAFLEVASHCPLRAAASSTRDRRSNAEAGGRLLALLRSRSAACAVDAAAAAVTQVPAQAAQAFRFRCFSQFQW